MSDLNRPVQILDPVAAYARWAASYPARAHNPLMRAEERAMLSLLPADLSGYTIFDAGCGSGRYMIHALRRGAARVLGADLSIDMLNRATVELQRERSAASSRRICAEHAPPEVQLIRAQLEALPIRERSADLTLCGLTIGHLPSLQSSLAELQRVTRPGGTILCSDFHPIGHALGWRREFTADGRRYAVTHTPFQGSDWQRACAALRLRIVTVLEPLLDASEIPADAEFDPVALKTPVAIVFQLERAAEAPVDDARG